MAELIDIRQTAKLKAAALADRLFELQHEISHGARPTAAQLENLEQVTARLDALPRLRDLANRLGVLRQARAFLFGEEK